MKEQEGMTAGGPMKVGILPDPSKQPSSRSQVHEPVEVISHTNNNSILIKGEMFYYNILLIFEHFIQCILIISNP